MMMHKRHKKGLWAIMGPVKGYIITAMGLSAISGTSTMVGYVLLAYVLSISGGQSIAFFGISLGFNQAFLIVAFVIILSFLINLYAFRISHLGAFKLEEVLRTQITGHLAKIPLGYVISTGTGPLKKVLLDDVKNLHAFVADTTPLISKSIAAPAASLIALLMIDYRLALVALSVLILGAVMMFFVMKDEARHRTNYERSQSDINKAVIEFVQAMPVVRTFDDGTTSFKRYNEALSRFRDHFKAWIAATSMAGRIAVTILSPMPTLIAVTIAGIFFVTRGSLAFVELIAVLLISTGMADALMPVMWGNTFIKQSQAAAVRIQEIMDLPRLKETSAFQYPAASDVVFDDVSFKYNEKDNYALRNISFTVSENTTTALVGPSGAGKSTAAKLIPRFWDVTQGCIKIGGTDIKEMDTATLMDTVSFVFQDTFLFNDTLANNIKIARNGASDEDMTAAAKAAQIHDFIMTLPDKYETAAGDRGTKLSGGQRQRITIARAILRNTPIVVLDEATAFADPENEEEIIKALSNLMKNKTVIVIAHRLSAIKDVEQIVVLDRGKLSETGRHDELLQKQGIYARLWRNYEKAQHWNLHRKGDVK
jgi:ATP-binding cassette, subfamily B, bacterial IrtA/YbtP